MTITIKEGRFVGEVQIDPRKEGKWMWTITETTFPGNKHADPDCETVEHPGRYYAKDSAISHCIEELEARIAGDTKVDDTVTKAVAQAIADYCPFEVSA